MKNNLVKQAILRVVGKAVELEANKIFSDRHAACIGLLHQPKRPKK